jgi:hypothetical protein
MPFRRRSEVVLIMLQVDCELRVSGFLKDFYELLGIRTTLSERECRITAEAANRNFETCTGRAGALPYQVRSSEPILPRW